MTRPTKRELERRVADLREKEGEDVLIAYADPITGALEDINGNPIDPADHGADQLVTFSECVVMLRRQAESENREIIGEYADAPEGRDLVEVVDDSLRAHGDP